MKQWLEGFGNGRPLLQKWEKKVVTSLAVRAEGP